MKSSLFFVIWILLFGFCLSGCAVFDSSTKEDEATAQRSALSEEILKVKQDINILNGQMDELQFKMDKLSQTQSQQSGELNSTLKDWRKGTQNDVDKRISSIETKLDVFQKKEEQDIKQLNDKTGIIVEEVSKENKALRKEIEALKKTPGRPSAAKTRTEQLVQEEGCYTVSAGDTLVKIAQMYGVSLKTLMEANNITDPNSIHTGQKLNIPQKK